MVKLQLKMWFIIVEVIIECNEKVADTSATSYPNLELKRGIGIQRNNASDILTDAVSKLDYNEIIKQRPKRLI